jgi:hypothetical protein
MHDFSQAVAELSDALMATIVVKPLSAALWLLSAMLLAVILVYAWQRVFGP